MNQFTTCISTHNNLNYLKLCIESINKNGKYNNFPIFIYAEGCTDGTNEWLQSLNDPKIKYWIREERWDDQYWGIGGGMNFLGEKVETEFFQFLHSDMYVGAFYDEELFELVQNNEKSMISSFRVEPNIFNKLNNNTGQLMEAGTITVPTYAFGVYYNKFEKSRFDDFSISFIQMNNIELPKVQGVSFMIKTQDWLDLGGNDPQFAPTSWEDMDLFLRARQENFKFITTSKSLIFHFGARGSHFQDDNLFKSSVRQIESEQKNIELFKNKWGNVNFDQYRMPYLPEQK